VWQGSATQQSLIWAFGTTQPSEAADSTLQQHIDSGAFSLDLSQTFDSSSVTSSGSSTIPLSQYQKTIVAHAVVATIAFLFLLPAGALLARFARTTSPKWFTGHWIVQAALGKK